MATNLLCPNCSQRLPIELFVAGPIHQCPACYSIVEAYIFPEFHRDPSAPPQIQLALEHEAACYFHSRYRAMTPCDHCGRFLCELCAISLGSRQLCPECLSHLRKQKNESGLVHYAALFDNVALFLVSAPLVTVIFWFFTILSAPLSLVFAVYYWSRQWNLLHRSRLHFSIAILLSVLVIAGWAFGIHYAVTTRK
jgi:hypothetical protein